MSYPRPEIILPYGCQQQLIENGVCIHKLIYPGIPNPGDSGKTLFPRIPIRIRRPLYPGIQIHTHTHTHTHTHMFTHPPTFTHTHLSMGTHRHTHRQMHAHMHKSPPPTHTYAHPRTPTQTPPTHFTYVRPLPHLVPHMS